MKIKGNIYIITNLDLFLPSYFLNQQNTDPGSFTAAKNYLVALRSVADLSALNVPTISKSDATNLGGYFELNINSTTINRLRANPACYLLVFRKTGTVRLPSGPRVDLYGPVYRSAVFDITTFQNRDVKVYLREFIIPEEDAVTQDDLDRQTASALRSDSRITSLRGTIWSRSTSVRASGQGGDVEFDLILEPEEGADLTSFLDFRIKNLEIDRPGPDIITNLCIPEADVKRMLRQAIGGMITRLNATIENNMIAHIAREANISERQARQFLNSSCSVTFKLIKHSLIRYRTIRISGVSIRLPVYGIFPRPVIGFPRTIFN